MNEGELDFLAQALIANSDGPQVDNGHGPKPIVLHLGKMNPPIMTSFLPLQILKIGNVGIVGIPGEITTMAGRRLRETCATALKEYNITDVVLTGYANEYSQYITTKEEYDEQHYEGASTLFGPHTLAAYQQEFTKLAYMMRAEGPPLGDKRRSFLRAGEQLNPGESIWNGYKDKYELRFQADGNLVLYEHDGQKVTPKWDSKSHDGITNKYYPEKRTPGACLMQDDGNLVIYDVFGIRAWDSGTRADRGSGSLLEVLHSDGTLRIRRQNNEVVEFANGRKGYVYDGRGNPR